MPATPVSGDRFDHVGDDPPTDPEDDQAEQPDVLPNGFHDQSPRRLRNIVSPLWFVSQVRILSLSEQIQQYFLFAFEAQPASSHRTYQVINKKEHAMADFMATCASNDPKLNDHEAVELIISHFYFDPNFNVGINFDDKTGEPYLFIYGYRWPEAWKVPAGIAPDDFDPYTEDLYEEGADGFIQFLRELAPHLAEP